MGFTQSHSGELGDIEGFIQLIPGIYKSDKAVNLTGKDKIHLKADYIQVSFVNGTREPILLRFALSSPLGHKIFKTPRIKLFKKVNKSVVSHITLYLEDDDHKAVNFNNETINFSCQLTKIKYSYPYTYHYLSFYTRGIHTIKFVFISETYLELYFYYFCKYTYIYKSIYTKSRHTIIWVFTIIRVLNELKYNAT